VAYIADLTPLIYANIIRVWRNGQK